MLKDACLIVLGYLVGTHLGAYYKRCVLRFFCVRKFRLW